MNIILFVFSSVVVLPLSVYLIVFHPWFGRGYSLGEFMSFQNSMFSMLQSLKDIDFKYMSKLHITKAYKWFIIPTIDGFKVPIGNQMFVILYAGNPFIWLCTLPSIAYIAFRYIKERAFPLLITAAAFFIQYAPLLFVRRPIYIHSAISVLPVAIVAIAYSFISISEKTRVSWLLNLYLLLNMLLVLSALPLIYGWYIPMDVYNINFRWLDPFLAFGNSR